MRVKRSWFLFLYRLVETPVHFLSLSWMITMFPASFNSLFYLVYLIITHWTENLRNSGLEIPRYKFFSLVFYSILFHIRASFIKVARIAPRKLFDSFSKSEIRNKRVRLSSNILVTKLKMPELFWNIRTSFCFTK